jgi:hypothetical protein
MKPIYLHPYLFHLGPQPRFWLSIVLFGFSLTLCVSCGQDTMYSESAEPSPCDLLRCEDKVCALIEDMPICICPQGLYDDGLGGCHPAPIPPPSMPCLESTCAPSHRCIVVEDRAQCLCPEGTTQNDLGECQMIPTDPSMPTCDETSCPNHQVCVVEEDQILCICPETLIMDEEGQCISPSSDPCETLTCPEGQICFFSNGRSYCSCPEGQVFDSSGLCVLPEVDPCEQVTCTDHQQCIVSDEETAECVCEDGFIYDEETNLCHVEEPPFSPNPCEPNPCTNEYQSTCLVVDERAVCECDHGYVEYMSGEGCELEQLDPCEPNPCVNEHQTICFAEDQIVTCLCDEGYIEVEGECRLPSPPTPCHPNPCLVPNRGVCEVIDGLSHCVCDPGLIEDPQTEQCEAPVIGLCPNSHFDGDLYEPNECSSEATPLPADRSQIHSIMPADDEDWFHLDAMPHHIYRFQVIRASLPNAILSLYHSDGRRLIFSQSSTYEITRELPEGGSYFYKVSAYNQSYTGDYTVHLDDLGMDDHGDGPGDATPLTLGAPPIDGHIETRGDDDWFSIEAEAGRIYHFELTRDSLSNAYVYLYHPDGQRIAESHSTPESISYDIDETGRWYFRVRHTSSTATGTYQISVSDVGVDDHSDDLAEGTPIISDGIPIDGDIETRGDHDYFSLWADQSHIYRISLAPLSLDSGYLSLYEPDGSLVTSSNSNLITFEAEQAGEWSILVRHLSITNTGSYRLRVEEIGIDDHTDTMMEASVTFADGEAINGVIETIGDRDYFMVNLSEGQRYHIDTTGIDTRITCYGPNGVMQLGSTQGETLDITPDLTGDHFVEVRSRFRSTTGAYTLSITQ